MAALAAMLAGGGGPAVVVGADGFDELVAALWRRLWPEARVRFSFRLSFGPQDIVEPRPPTLVCTLANLATRWDGHQVAAAREDGGRAAAILTGAADATPVLAFGRAIGADLGDLANLRLLERAWALAEAAASEPQRAIAALRLVEGLSPDPSAGADAKRSLVAQVARGLRSAATDQALRLRNVSGAAMPSMGQVWSALGEWVAAHPFDVREDTAMLALVRDAMNGRDAVRPWSEAVTAGLAAAARADPAPLAAAFWRWAETEPATAAALLRLLAPDDGTEGRFAEAAPDAIGRESGVLLTSEAARLGMRVLHGAAAGAAFRLQEAARMQLAVDGGLGSLAGFRMALRRATAADAVACALAIRAAALVEFAGERAAAEPSALRGIDPRDAMAQEVWTRALAGNQDAWSGPEDPRAAFGSVLDALLEGENAGERLISALACSPLGDLAGYGRRSEVWDRVSSETRQALLERTAAGWLTAARQSPPYPPDAQLQAVILRGDALERTLEALARATGIAAAVEITAKLDALGEERFRSWLELLMQTGRALGQRDAEAIGRLLYARQWSRAVQDLVAVAGRRRDLVPALRVCHAMVGWWQGFLLGISTPSSDDRWRLFEDVAIELYPSGPDCDDLWGRAGGRTGDLRHDGSGRGRWQDALGRVRRGAKGPTAAGLVRAMLDDFPPNERLQYLASEFGSGWRR